MKNMSTAAHGVVAGYCKKYRALLRRDVAMGTAARIQLCLHRAAVSTAVTTVVR